eukprot:TRINITY_DN9461_c0_g2_i2.p1 TRINITY_DN9461_c0_g2~~TRINITY_DN9461_c0_g2_i2.p1  ORF type:complete len:307 (+),score=36.57 TRINITY_DN9461_c0_g2_i2:82-1002(+)
MEGGERPQVVSEGTSVPAAPADDSVKRTVHVVGIDPAVMEGVFARVMADCGEVSNAKICGDPRGRTLYGFIEFTTEEGAQQLVAKSGTTIGSAQITTSYARSAIRSSNTGSNGKIFNLDGMGPLIRSSAYNSSRDDAWISTGLKKPMGTEYGRFGNQTYYPNMGKTTGGARSYGNRAVQQQWGATSGAVGQWGAEAVQQLYNMPLSFQTQQAMQTAGFTPEQQMMHYEMQVQKAYQQMGYSLSDMNIAMVEASRDSEKEKRRRRRPSLEDSRERRRRRDREEGSRERSRDDERKERRRRRRRTSSS